nr:MAG TPA: hypothetical protein [Caudoviricetes sp.]
MNYVKILFAFSFSFVLIFTYQSLIKRGSKNDKKQQF